MIAFLDLIGSTVIRGGIVLILLRLTLSMQEVLYERTEKAAMERNLSTVSEVLSYDIRQAGLGVSTTTFSTHDSNRVKFATDIDNNGMVDQIEYSLQHMSGTADPYKYVLHRIPSNGPDVAMARGVTQFRLWYYDSLGVETVDPSKIRSIFVVLRLRSDNFFNGRYPSASWQSHMFPANL
jgi:hypothetical protein